MPLFMPDEELARLSNDAASVAEKADQHIRKLYAELENVRAQADAASITAEQTCSLLEQKYILLSQEFSSVESRNAELQSSTNERLAEIAQFQAQKHQLHLQAIGKDGEIERLTMEISELHKAKRQLLELLEHKDNDLSEKNSTIKSYLDKIVNLTERCAGKEARLAEVEAELARSQATCSRLTQEKELTERHNVWLNEELAAKVDGYTELRRRHNDLEAEMSAKLVDADRKLNDCSSSLIWHKDRLRELEAKVTSLQEELCSSKDTAATTEEQYSAELSTANKLVDLYKESAEEWSRKGGELEGVVKALEARLSQVENDSKEKHEKDGTRIEELEKEVRELKQKLEESEAEMERNRKTNELNFLPVSNFSRGSLVDTSDTDGTVEESRMIVPKIPADVSGTALAASLLRDGWSLAKMYQKYQEAVDAVHHEQLGRREAESILQRVLSELEEKAGVIQDERVEYERMVEVYSLVNQKLQDSISEQSNLEKIILELKVEVKRHQRENILAERDISDLQKQVTMLLKECRDIQLRCGAANDDEIDDSMLSDIELDVESDADKVISENLLTFRDINGLVEQNVKLRNLVRNLSEQIESKEMDLKVKFEADLKNRTDEAASKVAFVLGRAEEQERMIESLHASVAMYKRLYEEEQKLRSSYSHHADSPAVAENGRRNTLDLLEDSQEAARKAQENVIERIRSLEEDLAKARTETISMRIERDKLAMEANFAREKLEGVVKEAERQREEINGVLARNVEFSQHIVDYQGKLRESSESLNAAEEHSRKLSMEVSVLKHEKEMLSNAEKRACDEVRSLSERVYRLQASLDTIQGTEEVREEARAAERRKQEEYIKQIEREWADAKKELQEERNSARTVTSGRDQTLNNAIKQVEEMGKELANGLLAVSAAESRAAVAEARLADLEKSRHSNSKTPGMNSGKDVGSLSSNEIIADLHQQMEKLKEEAEVNKNHMLQYKSIAHVNETALKQMESAHESFKLEAEKLQNSLEGELLLIRERVSELEKECVLKSEALAFESAGKEEALASALAEINGLKEENLVKSSQIEATKTQISVLKRDLEKEHERWRAAQGNYERQVILQSETIQELKKTSQALASLQEEASELRKLADSRGRENSELKAKWLSEKSMLEEQKNLAEKKYDELNEQNKVLHNRLQAMLIHSAEKERGVGGSSAGTDFDPLGDSSLQTVVSYLRKSKEIAETEISLLKQEKLRLQSQLENALKTAENAQASLSAERAGLRASLLTEEEIKSLQLQVREINLLRESNSQLREENKYNFEECQKLREVAHKARMDSENLENLLRQRQIELDSCKKEIDIQRTEKDLQEKRVNELLERFKNIDVADYDHLKDCVRQLEGKMKEKDTQMDDIKNLLSEKKKALSQLEQELANTKQELNARDNGLNEAQQGLARLKAENDRLKKVSAHLKRTRDALSKEKEEMIQEKETLSRQLEEMKQSKGSRIDSTSDHVMKDKDIEEKEHKIQILENIVEKLRGDLKKRDDELKKKEEELIKQKADRVSDQKTIKDSLSKVHLEKTKVKNELEKLDKYQSAVARLSEELDKLKHAEGNLPEGTSVVQILSGTIVDDSASAFMSAVEFFENVAHSVATDIRGGSTHTGTVANVPMESSTSDPPSTTLTSSNISSPVMAPPATSQPTKSAEEKEKRPALSKPKTRMGRKIVRPQLVKPEEQPQADAEISEAEGIAKAPSHNTESQGIVVPSSQPSQSTLRKRHSTSSLTSDSHQGVLVQGETGTDIIPPVQKKLKSSDLQSESHEGTTAASQVENVTTTPPVLDQNLNTIADMPQVSTEDDIPIDADAEKEETEISTEAAEEPLENQQLENENEMQVDASEAMEESMDQPTEAEAGVDEDVSRDQTDKEDQELPVDMESEREEGELDTDAGEENEETGDDLPGPVIATPTGSPTRMDATMQSTLELEEGETLEALNEEGYEDEEITVEGFDKSNDGNVQHVMGADPSVETAPINTSTTIATPATSTTTVTPIIVTAMTAATVSTTDTASATPSTAATATTAATPVAPTTATAMTTTTTSVAPSTAAAATPTATTVAPTATTAVSPATASATTMTTASTTTDGGGENTTLGDGTAEREETKRATSPLSGSSTIVNLSERARERSALRQAQVRAGAGTRALAPQGRARGGRVGSARGATRGGRNVRGGRGPPPGQQ